jgi:hypothetical protein
MSFKCFVKGAIFGKKMFLYETCLFFLFSVQIVFTITKQQTNKRTLIICALPYTDIHLHFSVGFATIIVVLHKNTDKIKQLLELRK